MSSPGYLPSDPYYSFFENDDFLDDFLSPTDEEAILSELDLTFRKRIDQFGFTPPPEKPEARTNYQNMAAFKGDDEVMLQSSPLIGCAALSANEFLELKISEKDTGFSHVMGNYAEEWILLPFCRNMTYRSAIKYGRYDYVPWTLDTVKLKMLSPVRKQSILEDDLESKIGYLSISAAWCNKEWFMYDFHHLSLILAIEIFDYPMSDTFLFLEKEDGGMACTVPWDSPTTLAMYLKNFHAGKPQNVIHKMMEESVDIKSGVLKPTDTFALKGVSAYRASTELWTRYVRTWEAAKQFGLYESDIDDLFMGINNIAIPPDLEAKAFPVDISNPIIACGISQLRTHGDIMTDTDVKVFFNDRERLSAIWGPKPMGEVLKEAQERKELIIKRPLKILEGIVASYKGTSSLIRRRLEPTTSLLEVCSQYIAARTKYKNFHTSFMYAGRVRVYRSQDVKNYFSYDNNKELLDSLFGFHFDVPLRNERLVADPVEQAKWENIKSWLQEPDPFLSRIPVGIGPDDARILAEIAKFKPNQLTDLIIITNDRGLYRQCKQFLQLKKAREQKKNYEVFRLSVTDYFVLCDQTRMSPSYRGVGEMYNLWTRQIVGAPASLVKRVREILRQPGRQHRLHFFYDFPNIERYAPLIEMKNGTLKKHSGGFLTKATVERLNENGMGLALHPIENIPRLLTQSTTMVRLHLRGPYMD